MSQHDAWSTENEIAWLKTIGQSAVDHRMPDRVELLKNYIEGARKRKRWAPMDRATVLVAAHEELYRSSAT
jgi:hypothetical protein